MRKTSKSMSDTVPKVPWGVTDLRSSLYADFVTSCIAFARYPTLPVVTPAMLHAHEYQT